MIAISFINIVKNTHRLVKIATLKPSSETARPTS